MFPLRSRWRPNRLQGRHERDPFCDRRPADPHRRGTDRLWRAGAGAAADHRHRHCTLRPARYRAGDGAGHARRRVGRPPERHAPRPERSHRPRRCDGAGAGRQADMARAVNERLDSVTHRVGQSMEQTTRNTMDSLRVLHERLGIIDNAHKNLTDLTSQVTTLRDVLANKQSRGAFGQARMEAIVQDGMPKGSYEFQFTLSTGKRPDCVVFLPDQRPLCIDAKFPLEAMTALHDARSEEEKKFATQRLRADVMKHVSDIAEKYLIAGETQDTALMFVPSESVYAEIHDGFDD